MAVALLNFAFMNPKVDKNTLVRWISAANHLPNRNQRKNAQVSSEMQQSRKNNHKNNWQNLQFGEETPFL